MIVMQLNNITKYFGADLILSKIKLEVHHDDRIAIVGRNGAGKSTLLKIMSEQMPYDEGDLFKPKDVTVGYLDQHTGLNSNKTIWDEMLTVFRSLIELEEELRQMEQKMADPSFINDEHAYQQLLAHYDEKQNKFQQRGGFQYEADIESILNGLSFGDIDRQTPIETLSGGQKTRLALGKLLLAKPDILILDEPTNHLDIETLRWLENYLKNYQGAIVMVSHDRYFLDETVNVVYDVAFQSIKKYHGNYSYFLKKRVEDYELEVKRFEKQQEEVKKLEEYIQKNIARDSTSKQAKSRRKKLEKMDLMNKPNLDNHSAKFTFDINRKSGNDVLKVDSLTAKYDANEDPVFENVSFQVNRGDRIAIVGPNGIGKSTLLKAILKKLNYVSGHIQYGTNVEFGYYDQEQATLNKHKTALQEIWDEYPLMPEKDIRTVLGNFLFSGDDVLKTIGMLSGGEKARILLAKLMLKKSNVLIMDEPTNHLDLDSKEVLESALLDYPGTLIFVSHDRYFINRLATHVVELSKQQARNFIGDYDYYVEKTTEEMQIKALKEEKEEPKKTNNQSTSLKDLQREQRRISRRIQVIEDEIEQQEQIIEENESKLYDSEIANDYSKLQELNQVIKSSRHAIEQLMEEWEELQVAYEELEA